MAIQSFNCPFCGTQHNLDWWDGFIGCEMCGKSATEIQQAIKVKCNPVVDSDEQD